MKKKRVAISHPFNCITRLLDIFECVTFTKTLKQLRRLKHIRVKKTFNKLFVAIQS